MLWSSRRSKGHLVVVRRLGEIETGRLGDWEIGRERERDGKNAYYL